MKRKICLMAACLVLMMLVCACGPPPGQIVAEKNGAPPGDAPEATGPATETPIPVPPTEPPTPSPPPTPKPLPTPDAAGSGDVLFDIYTDRAFADIDNDGTDEEILFDAAPAASTLTIDGTPYLIDTPDLAQIFAITDVNISDGILEIAFTDVYREDLADTEFVFTWYYWFNGTDFVRMGGLMDMKFAGAWRAGFDPSVYMDGHSTVMCLTRSEHFTDIWYTGKYSPNGASRKFREVLYVTQPVFPVQELELKAGHACILLHNIDNTYFDPAYAAMWDYASWPHADGRVADPNSDGVINLIAVGPETLQVIKVYGKLWTKLQTADGYSGWVKVVDSEMWFYNEIMNIDVYDMFDGIMFAG